MVYLSHGTQRRRRGRRALDWTLVLLLAVNVAALVLIVIGLREVIRWIA